MSLNPDPVISHEWTDLFVLKLLHSLVHFLLSCRQRPYLITNLMSAALLLHLVPDL